MDGKGIKIDDKNINKSNFYKNKKPFEMDEIDTNKSLLPKKEPYGKKKSIKYFVEYHDKNFIRALCTKLPQMIGYIKCFNSNKTMSFKASDKRLLKKYTKI